MSEVEPMTPKRFSKIIEDIVKEKQVTHGCYSNLL